MPNGIDVEPRKWSNITHLYDNGWYSAIWGNYDGDVKKSLGVRWNGDDSGDIGYPNGRGYPAWFVEPDFLTEAILEKLLIDVVRNPSHGNLKSIENALSEFLRQ